jgi:phosphopantothenoylcysteine decarboxylase/phosphopantothenate--cysteine ligase
MSEVEAIRGTYSSLLKSLKVVLVVSSSISIYKSIDTARLLIRHGADVYVFMTQRAAKLVAPDLFWWATGNKPVVKLTGAAEHVEICEKADVVLVAPATANTLVKLSLGIADNAALTCALAAASARRVVVPAMSLAMWSAPQVQEAVRRLQERAVVVPPVVEEGRAKYPPPDEIVECAVDATAPRDLEGARVLVTAGPTREHIDDVKYITTPSSGLTGYYLAREAAARGARVTLVAGPARIGEIPGVDVVRVTSVLEMHRAVLERAGGHDVFIFAAAPLDFYVEGRARGKLDSSATQHVLVLRRAPKIPGDVRARNPKALIVGFKAEWGAGERELIERARQRMEEEGWDVALAHDVSRAGFGTLHDEYYVITGESVTRVGPAHKRELARRVLTLVRELLARRASTAP